MTTLRRLAAAVLSWGVISPGWYAVLTGTALLVVGTALAGARRDDPAAGVVGVLLVVAAVWQLERGFRAVLRRGSHPGDEAT